MIILEQGERYCLTYEEWLELAVQDPEAYGMTQADADASYKIYHAGKALENKPEGWLITDSVQHSRSEIKMVELNTTQPKE